MNYQLIDIKLQPLFTRISVKLPPPPPPRQRGWLESLSENIQETQNKIVNSVLEKINEVTEELTRDEEELSAVKIYYWYSEGQICILKPWILYLPMFNFKTIIM